MTVTVRCSCGKQSNLPISFVGKRVRCNFCGALSVVQAEPPEGHADLDWETHVAESLLSAPAPSAEPAGGAAVLEAEPEVDDSPAFDEVPSSGEVAAVAEMPEAAPAAMPAAAPVAGAKEYKVLTQRDKWFGGRFDPERFEAALNFFAAQGWVVRSMAAGSILGGNREELVVLLER